MATKVKANDELFLDTGTANDLASLESTPSNLSSLSSFDFSAASQFSASSNCGVAVEIGYDSNSTWQFRTIVHSNRCVEQQKWFENQQKLETIKSTSRILTTCIEARVQAATNHIQPDSICRLEDFQVPLIK